MLISVGLVAWLVPGTSPPPIPLNLGVLQNGGYSECIHDSTYVRDDPHLDITVNGHEFHGVPSKAEAAKACQAGNNNSVSWTDK
jgi:hypothetical protein